MYKEYLKFSMKEETKSMVFSEFDPEIEKLVGKKVEAIMAPVFAEEEIKTNEVSMIESVHESAEASKSENAILKEL